VVDLTRPLWSFVLTQRQILVPVRNTGAGLAPSKKFERIYREVSMPLLRPIQRLALLVIGASCSVACIATAKATTTPTFNISSTFNFIQDQGANDGGFLSGISDIFGIFVTPVGTQPTPSVDGTSVTATQGTFKTGVPYFFSTANPTEFVQALPFPAFSNLTGPWTFHRPIPQ
jgi:hypothetical protein